MISAIISPNIPMEIIIDHLSNPSSGFAKKCLGFLLFLQYVPFVLTSSYTLQKKIQAEPASS